MKATAPAFSIALNELTQQLIVKIDDGKFMDSQYIYTEIQPNKTGVVEYKVQIQSLIVNGVYRDIIEVENRYPELSGEFHSIVATPVLDELVVMMGAAPEPQSKIILQ